MGTSWAPGDADRFDDLSSLIESCEARAWPIEALDAGDALMTVMADCLISRKKRAPVVGSKSRWKKFLNRKRGLTMAGAKRLRDELQVPASILIWPYVAVLPTPFGTMREWVRAGGAWA